MVRTASTMLELGTTAPDFTLPNFDGQLVSLDDCCGPKGVLVVFMCNHCPYVIHVADELAKVANEYQQRGVGFVGINSNDIEKYPDDGPQQMKAEAAQRGYQFPYLLDESQQVAGGYNAACTPDFFLFDAERKLVYRGQLDDSRPKQGTQPDGRDLRAALDAMLAGEPIADPQKPSIGCNIKWKSGAEPAYFDPNGSAPK